MGKNGLFLSLTSYSSANHGALVPAFLFLHSFSPTFSTCILRMFRPQFSGEGQPVCPSLTRHPSLSLSLTLLRLLVHSCPIDWPTMSGENAVQQQQQLVQQQQRLFLSPPGPSCAVHCFSLPPSSLSSHTLSCKAFAFLCASFSLSSCSFPTENSCFCLTRCSTHTRTHTHTHTHTCPLSNRNPFFLSLPSSLLCMLCVCGFTKT